MDITNKFNQRMTDKFFYTSWIYKDKRDVQEYSNYKKIKLVSQSMEIREQIIDIRKRRKKW